jgi:HD-like signal output (HDOD) protein
MAGAPPTSSQAARTTAQTPLAEAKADLPGLPTAAMALRKRLAALVKQGQLKVPMLPQVTVELVKLMGSPHADAARLSLLIHKDPALAGRILRVVNSAALGPPSPITSLTQAVTWLGFTKLRELAFAASVEHGVFQVKGFEGELRAIWRTTLATAIFSKRIARQVGLDTDEAYLAGLLHRIGAPVLLQAGLTEAPGVGLTPKTVEGRLQIFRAADDLTARAGAAVAAGWKLPEPIAAAIAHHEDPEAAKVHGRLAALVFTGRRLATLALAPDDAGVIESHPAFALLGLGPSDLGHLLGESDEIKRTVDGLTG